MIVVRDAAEVSSEQLRRVKKMTDTVKIQIETASVDPTSAKVSAIAEAEATEEACVSVAWITARGVIAAERKKQPGVTVKKKASSSIHKLCTCARADAAPSPCDVEAIVVRRESARSGVVVW
eukprot:4143930-Pleurochrysis_carterae.AAC.1